MTVVHRRLLGRSFQLIAEAGFELYGSETPDSPIARQDYEAKAGLSVVYMF